MNVSGNSSGQPSLQLRPVISEVGRPRRQAATWSRRSVCDTDIAGWWERLPGQCYLLAGLDLQYEATSGSSQSGYVGVMQRRM